jgi:hypothetical protein
MSEPIHLRSRTRDMLHLAQEVLDMVRGDDLPNWAALDLDMAIDKIELALEEMRKLRA